MNKQPSFESVRKWHEAVLRHSMHVEFYSWSKSSFSDFSRNTVSELYEERPHDVAGDFSKLDPEIIYGLAMQFEDGGFAAHQKQIMEAVELHRNQAHHHIFNNSDVARNASKYDLFQCGIDAVCSLLESDARKYQGGLHTFDDIRVKVIPENPEHKQPWMNRALDHIVAVGPIDIGRISLDNPFNVGLPEKVYSDIVKRVQRSMEIMGMVYG